MYPNGDCLTECRGNAKGNVPKWWFFEKHAFGIQRKIYENGDFRKTAFAIQIEMYPIGVLLKNSHLEYKGNV